VRAMPPTIARWMLAAAMLCLVQAAVCAGGKQQRAGEGNLRLAEKDGKLVGSFTYRLTVGHLYEWNTDPTAIPGILSELAKRSGVKARMEFKAIGLDDPRLMRNPVLMMTGNRGFLLTQPEIENLRRYLEGGGVLYMDDCGGADYSLRRMMKQVLPDAELQKLEPAHPLFREAYKLDGVPKVVDLYRGPALCFGAKIGDRLAVIYTYDTDLPCAWERYPDGSYVHAVDPKKREAATRFGVNVLLYALRQHMGKVAKPGAEKAPALPKPTALPAASVRNFPMQRQLPCTFITAMAADERHIWFGGYSCSPGEDEGLGRYDKRTRQWRLFMDAEGVLSEEINCLLPWGDEVLVGADTWKWTKGLATFHPATGRWSTLTTKEGLPHDRVVAIAADGEDLWIGCRQGLALLRKGSGKAEPVTSPLFPEGGPFVIDVMADGQYVWVNHFEGLVRLDKAKGQWQKGPKLTPLVPGHVAGMAHAGGSAWLLAGRDDGVHLVRFDRKAGTFEDWPAAKDLDLRSAVSVAAWKNEVIVGTGDEGVYVFAADGGRPTHHAMPDPLPKGKVRKILPDQTGVWISILPSGGVWRLNRETDKWRHVPHRAGTPAAHVLSLAHAEGTLYVGTVGAGPWAYEPQRDRWRNLNLELMRDGHPFRYLGERTQIRWDNIYALAPDEGRVWMATNHGLVVHDPDKTPGGFEVIGPDEAVCTAVAPSGGLVWVAETTGRVRAYRPEKGEWSPGDAFSVGAPARGLCLWHEALYVASEKGLFARNAGGKLERIGGENGPADVRGLWAGPAALWFATPLGLHRMSKPAGKPLRIEGSENWGAVHCVAPLEGLLLVGTEHGLFACDLDGTLRAYCNGQSGLGADGIAAIAADARYVWLGTLGGGITRIERKAFTPE